MKPRFIKGTTTASFALFALCLASTPALRAQLPPSPGHPGYQPVELATPEKEAFRVTHLAGKPVRGANQEEFGTISDFLLEPQSGRVHFAVVATGGNTFRIVPMTAQQPGSGAEGLIVGLERSQWDQIPLKSEQELLSSVTIDAAQQQQLQQQFQLAAGEQPVEGLIRATLLNERELRAGGERVGTVDDVVIDFNNRIAAPLVRTAPGFGAGEQRVLIHFSRLQVSPESRGPITASLGRGDFHQLRSPHLAPTGYTGGFHQQGQQPAHRAAMAVQQALERDAAVRGTVQAVPETRIVLRGAVESEQKRIEIEQAAQQAAQQADPGVRVDNQLMVRSQ